MSRELFDDAVVAQRFALHYDTVRGRVRTEVVHRQLLEHLPPAPGALVDVGGGAGTQSIPLARRGWRVTIVDPAPAMLERAAAALADEPLDVAARVTLVEGSGEDAPALVDAGAFGAVLCHGVLMYLDDPAPMLDALAALAAPAAVVSVVATNRHALADRPARRGQWREALALFDADRYVNGLGLDARADDPDAVADALDARGIDAVRWYGVRVFTDAGPIADEVDVDEDAALAVEWEAGRRDPYRWSSRLFHLVGTRRP
jgi:SAM-dependent methyltransferase